MKNFCQFCAAIVLTSVIALSASGGDIQFPGVAQPRASQSAVMGEIQFPGLTGDIQSPGVAELDPVTEFALSLLQSMLTLFY